MQGAGCGKRGVRLAITRPNQKMTQINDIPVVFAQLGFFIGEGRLRSNDRFGKAHVDDVSFGRQLLLGIDIFSITCKDSIGYAPILPRRPTSRHEAVGSIN